MPIVYFTALAISVISGVIFLALREKLPHWIKWDKPIALVIVAVLFSPVCLCMSNIAISEIVDRLTPRPLHPTYKNLVEHGFYAFVLPEQEVSQRQWKQDISLWSWDNCDMLAGDTPNPLQITYEDRFSNRAFEIQIGPWRMAWDRPQATTTTQVILESKWSGTGILTYYTRPAQDNLSRHLYHFVDMKGTDVDIASSLSVTETLELIERFEYIGPSLEVLKFLMGPWVCD